VLNRVVGAAIGGVVEEEPSIITLNGGELNAPLAYILSAEWAVRKIALRVFLILTADGSND
jgi:hypothetical protein